MGEKEKEDTEKGSKKEKEKEAIPMTFALVQHVEMKDEMKGEALESCITACEKYPDDLEVAAQHISEEMQQKFCGNWHVTVGESFGFEVTHEVDKLLYTFFGGNLAILVWSM